MALIKFAKIVKNNLFIKLSFKRKEIQCLLLELEMEKLIKN